jgi:uncharacterized repeat protein (TIGR01451 family)
MANETFTAKQGTVLTTDNDVGGPDGVIDPGDVVTTTVTITNNSTTPTPVAATGVEFTEILDGMTIVDQPGADINVSPIAFDEQRGRQHHLRGERGRRHSQRFDRHPRHLGRGRRVLHQHNRRQRGDAAHIVTTGVIEA